MTSAAYTVGRDSIAEAFAEGSPVAPFFASAALLGVLLDEERAHPAPPSEVTPDLLGIVLNSDPYNRRMYRGQCSFNCEPLSSSVPRWRRVVSPIESRQYQIITW